MAKAKKQEVPTLTTIGAFRLTAGGLKVEGSPTFNQWEAAVIEAKALGWSLMWVIGDLLIYGEEKYGDEYTQALEAADYADETIRQAQRIAKQFPPDVRVASLPFSFHRTVAPLPQKKALALLKRADDLGWTRAVLAMEVSKLNPQQKPANSLVPVVPETADLTPPAALDDTDPEVVDADPAKCLEAVAGMAKALKKWRAFFSAIMASPFAGMVINAAGGFGQCDPAKTGERVEIGSLGPYKFGPLEYSTPAIDELLNFGGNLRAMFTRCARPEVPGEGVGEWEREQ